MLSGLGTTFWLFSPLFVQSQHFPNPFIWPARGFLRPSSRKEFAVCLTTRYRRYADDLGLFIDASFDSLEHQFSAVTKSFLSLWDSSLFSPLLPFLAWSPTSPVSSFLVPPPTEFLTCLSNLVQVENQLGSTTLGSVLPQPKTKTYLEVWCFFCSPDWMLVLNMYRKCCLKFWPRFSVLLDNPLSWVSLSVLAIAWS